MIDPSLSAVLVNTRATVAAAQEAFAAWALSAVRAAGVPDARVVIGGGGPSEGVVVRLSPLRIGTPGRSLDGGGTPLITPFRLTERRAFPGPAAGAMCQTLVASGVTHAVSPFRAHTSWSRNCRVAASQV